MSEGLLEASYTVPARIAGGPSRNPFKGILAKCGDLVHWSELARNDIDRAANQGRGIGWDALGASGAKPSC